MGLEEVEPEDEDCWPDLTVFFLDFVETGGCFGSVLNSSSSKSWILARTVLKGKDLNPPNVGKSLSQKVVTG